MIEILKALATAAALLLPVVILTVIVSRLSVNRGEAAMHPVELAPEAVSTVDQPEAAKTAKAGFMPARDPSVLEILILGLALFMVMMGIFLGWSVWGQAG